MSLFWIHLIAFTVQAICTAINVSLVFANPINTVAWSGVFICGGFAIRQLIIWIYDSIK